MKVKNKSYANLFHIALALALLSLPGCRATEQSVDQIYYNGVVYTVDSSFTVVTAFAVNQGIIVATGSDKKILEINAKEKINLNGKFVYPGFHDGHCHFYGYGIDLKKIWLIGTTSFDDVLDTLALYKNQLIGGWLFGRGWDQNQWNEKKYPDKSELDKMFPSTPVFLLRIDGHAALVNQTALNIAGINEKTVIAGGLVEKRNGKLTGILLDKAVDMVYDKLPGFSLQEKIEALLNAQRNCFAVGLTSVTDAGVESGGLKWDIISIIESLHQSNQLKMKVNAMAAIEETDFYKTRGKTVTNLLSVHSFKMYADGALGSRGACLLQPYSDQPGHSGFLIHDPNYLDSIAALVAGMDFQLNTHCIGDSSHRLMLKIYAKYLSEKNNHRWRIEHAQVINSDDLHYYGDFKIISSVQPVHATSDMYWAPDRLGPERIKGAYAYSDLMKQNNFIISGSDFPVEHINPLYGFYAAIARKDHSGYPQDGFQVENKLSRQDALRSMTIWPAYGAFRENESGTIEPGKMADFVILQEDIMTIPENEIWKVKVISTYVNGEKVYYRGE